MVAEFARAPSKDAGSVWCCVVTEGIDYSELWLDLPAHPLHVREYPSCPAAIPDQAMRAPKVLVPFGGFNTSRKLLDGVTELFERLVLVVSWHVLFSRQIVERLA
jgi:hypothetical protein